MENEGCEEGECSVGILGGGRSVNAVVAGVGVGSLWGEEGEE